jgi:hypothetical protein
MSQSTDTREDEQEEYPAQSISSSLEEIREALARLRQVGEKLPPVDAVEVIREGRDLAAQESR